MNGRILFADDDAEIRNVFGVVLERKGFEVAFAATGAEAKARLETETFDVILADIIMPDVNGVELLRAVRKRDLDAPVILMTGSPSAQTAIDAVNLGAYRYLLKPIGAAEFVETVSQAVRISKFARLRREALSQRQSSSGLDADLAGIEEGFERALEQLWLAFQPIVSWSGRRVVGYEALMRSDYDRLATPDAVLGAAERVEGFHRVGRRVRGLAAEAAASMPPDLKLFVNLHPTDLEDESLYGYENPLTAYAGKVVFEITERAHLKDAGQLKPRIEELKTVGFGIAIDDLGAGYSGLNTFALLEPSVAKIDMELIQGVHKDPTRQHLVRAVAELGKEMSIAIIAEGVETIEDQKAVVDLGVDWTQGYYFAKPGRGFIEAAPEWFEYRADGSEEHGQGVGG